MKIRKEVLQPKNNPTVTVERMLREKFTRLLGRKDRALPNVEVIVLLGPHGTESDMKPVQKLLRQSDIYVPENHGWIEETLKTLNNHWC